jgi:hypothetical protein
MKAIRSLHFWKAFMEKSKENAQITTTQQQRIGKYYFLKFYSTHSCFWFNLIRLEEYVIRIWFFGDTSI